MAFSADAAKQNAYTSSGTPKGNLTNAAYSAFGITRTEGTIPVPLKGGKKSQTLGAALAALSNAQVSNPEAVQRYQELLYAGHFYKDSYYGKSTSHSPVYGIVDDDTLAAYTKALKAAARTNQSVDVILEQVANKTGIGTDGNVKTADIVGTDIAATADATAMQRYGRRLTPSELDKLASQFNTQAQTDPNASISQFAYSQLQQNNPTEAMGQDVRNTMNEFFSALGPTIETGNNG